MSAQVVGLEGTPRRGVGVGGAFAVENGRKGAQERERRRLVRLDETREALELRLAEIAERMVKGALGEEKVNQVQYLLAKDILDRVMGQATQRVESVRLDAIDEAFRELVKASDAGSD